MSELRIWRRHKLPHWEAQSATYFLTFHLRFCIPRTVIERHKKELDSSLPLVQQQARFRKNLERYLDCPTNALLSDANLATIVRDTLLHGHMTQYELLAWVVMPNHAHVVFRLSPELRLDSVVQQWKSVSAHKINARLNTSGPVWQKEYFDRIMRNGAMTDRAIAYVKRNPEKSGLKDWKFVG